VVTPPAVQSWPRWQLLVLIFAIELVNGLVHHGFRGASVSGSMTPLDGAATLVLVLLLCSVAAVGSAPALSVSRAILWALCLWFYSMGTSLLIIAFFAPATDPPAPGFKLLAVSMLFSPIAVACGYCGVWLARRRRV